MSEEIIKILDDLGSRLGIAIDWTSDNVIPYLQDLMTRFIELKNIQAIIWIIISLVIIIITVIGIIKLIKYLKKQNKNDYDYDDIAFYVVVTNVVIGFITLSFVIVLLCNVFGLLQNIFTPEITIMDYISNFNV